MRPLRRILLTLALLLTIALATTWRLSRSRRAGDANPVVLNGSAMGSEWSVKIPRLPAHADRDDLQESAATLLESLEQQMSLWRPTSDVCRFNASPSTDWQSVPPELAEVVAIAQEVSAQSGGAFDVTVAPLVNLWGFGPEPRGVRAGELPTDAAISAARVHVGYAKLEVRTSPPALRKSDPQLSIDLGGIGKGFAADKLGQLLDARGVTDYLVAVGGELRARGRAPDGKPWRVGIEAPIPDARRVLCAVDLPAGSLSTSGDYRNFADLAGRRYSHEIDPRAGRPITGNLASVSVLHPSGAYADAWATALIVLGSEEGRKVAAQHQLAAQFVSRSDDRLTSVSTPGFPATQP